MEIQGKISVFDAKTDLGFLEINPGWIQDIPPPASPSTKFTAAIIVVYSLFDERFAGYP